jgi:hypothetical protein
LAVARTERPADPLGDQWVFIFDSAPGHHDPRQRGVIFIDAVEID